MTCDTSYLRVMYLDSALWSYLVPLNVEEANQVSEAKATELLKTYLT